MIFVDLIAFLRSRIRGVKNFREDSNFYNDGVLFAPPNAMRSLVTKMPAHAQREPYKLAVFDMDGTTINASSPTLLVRKLVRERKLKFSVACKIMKWALSYKFHLPRENDPVREKVFTAFQGKNAREVGRELERFAEDKIVPCIRHAAVLEMQKHLDNGVVVILLSASFDSVVSRMLLSVPANFGLATCMKIDEVGNYTNKVSGIAPEGDGKPLALKEFADAQFGRDNWEVVGAYGDHMSDDAILKLAKHPVAVTPDRKLLRYAKSVGWEVAQW